MMEAGKLNRKIRLQFLTVTKNPDATLVETWADVAGASFVPASLEPLKGREYFQAAAMTAENTIPVTIRYRPGVTAALRVLYGTRILNIRHVLNVEERNVKLILLCEEVVNGN
jgi:SPP1 family predicted phage head-tail adaptor